MKAALFAFILIVIQFDITGALSMNAGEIYNIPGGSWRSPTWNWGYAQGTGHDCAMICRERYNSQKDRTELVEVLWEPCKDDKIRKPPFEEVKLVLGLTWQRGRWDGSDGGIGGYGDVLEYMAECRYETEDDQTNAIQLVTDMKKRFHLIASEAAAEKMKNLDHFCDGDVDLMRRKCAALVLSEMGFVKTGL